MGMPNLKVGKLGDPNAEDRLERLCLLVGLEISPGPLGMLIRDQHELGKKKVACPLQVGEEIEIPQGIVLPVKEKWKMKFVNR